MLRLPEENIEHICEYTKSMLKVIIIVVVLVAGISFMIWNMRQTDITIEYYDQLLNQEILIEQLPQRMKGE